TEVGHQADAVRQFDTIGEGGSALVVHEQERHAVRTVRRGNTEYPGLKELRLSGTGRAPDERVRPLGPQIEGHRVTRALADDRAEVSGLLQAWPRRVRAVDDRVVLPPSIDHGVGVLGDLVPDQR